MFDVRSLSGSSGLLFDSPFLSPLLWLSCSLCLVIFSANGPFPCLFFTEKSQTFFVKIFGMALVEGMIDVRWHLLPYGTGICHYVVYRLLKSKY